MTKIRRCELCDRILKQPTEYQVYCGGTRRKTETDEGEQMSRECDRIATIRRYNKEGKWKKKPLKRKESSG